MITVIYKNKRLKINLKRVFGNIIILTLITAFSYGIIDFFRFPECYLTTWKYQLQNEIKAGNQEMIDYYNHVYVENNRSLFD